MGLSMLLLIIIDNCGNIFEVDDRILIGQYYCYTVTTTASLDWKHLTCDHETKHSLADFVNGLLT